MLRLLIALVLLPIVSASAMATTWARDDQPDPFSDGQCIAHSPMSSGSYIYHWPSKYDLVFWPFTDPNWIWYCPESGYVAFGSDFEVEDHEREAIQAVLLTRQARWQAIGWKSASDWEWSEVETHYEELVDALEEIARSRASTDWSWYNRIFAQLHLETQERADQYRRDAIPFLVETLDGQDAAARAQTLYVLGAYSLRLGDEDASDRYFSEAQRVNWIDDDGAEQTGVPYLNTLIEEVGSGALDENWGVRTPSHD
jgi:hypothetical protein